MEIFVDMTKIFRLGSWYPNIERVFVLSLIRQSIRHGLGERPITPPSRYAPTLYWKLLTGQGYQRAVYLWCCVTPQLLLSLRLGLWPSESNTSEIMAKPLSTRERNEMRVSDPTECIKQRYPPKREIFVMIFINSILMFHYPKSILFGHLKYIF